MQEKVEAKTLAGFMELLPQEQILFNQMKETIKQTYENFGFLPLDTPIIELSNVLLAKAGGETEKQIYRFAKGETDLALRFDLTVPLAKYVTEYYNLLSFPFRRYQIGKVYRGERPQRGRFREFYQCDIDVIGDGELNIMADAEMPSVIYRTFQNLGFDDFTICINNRKILTGLFSYLGQVELSVDIMRIIDKFDKIGQENVISELTMLGVDNQSVKKIIEFISITGTADEKIAALNNFEVDNEMYLDGVSELTKVVEGIRLFGVPENYFSVDFTIARGLDYYTGTVYETFLNSYRKIGSVCSGGRYDSLAEYYTERKLPGVGISIGLTRLFYQLNEYKLIKADKVSISEVLVVSTSEDVKNCISCATEFRKRGVNAEVYLNNKKMKLKFKYADKLGIPYVVIIGEEELEKGKISLKIMRTGKQEQLTIEEAIQKISNR